jgi:hypothetical protein
VCGIKLDKEVYIALRAEVLAQIGPENGQLADVTLPTEFFDHAFGNKRTPLLHKNPPSRSDLSP